MSMMRISLLHDDLTRVPLIHPRAVVRPCRNNGNLSPLLGRVPAAEILYVFTCSVVSIKPTGGLSVN